MEDTARAIFEATPHRHPAGHVPDWDAQPEQVKAVFRGFAERAARAAAETRDDG